MKKFIQSNLEATAVVAISILFSGYLFVPSMIFLAQRA